VCVWATLPDLNKMEWKNGMVSMIDQLLPLPLPADKTRIQL